MQRGLQIHRNYQYLSSMFSYIFASIQQRTCRLRGSVGSCQFGSHFIGTLQFRWIYTYTLVYT